MRWTFAPLGAKCDFQPEWTYEKQPTLVRRAASLVGDVDYGNGVSKVDAPLCSKSNSGGVPFKRVSIFFLLENYLRLVNLDTGGMRTLARVQQSNLYESSAGH